MRIALVSPYSLERFGGVQTQVLGLARALGELDDVTVLAPEARSTRTGIDLIDLGATTSVPVNGSRAPIALSPTAWRRTLGAIGDIGPDVVHVHEPFVPAVGLAAVRSGRPVVATFHRSGADVAYRSVGPLLIRFARRIGAAAAVSEAAASTVRQALGPLSGPLAILPNAVDSPGDSSLDTIRSKTPVMVFVGRFEQRKGLAVLLEAFSKLEGDVALEVIGTGPDEALHRERHANDARITFLGALDDAGKGEHLRRATIFVAPSLGGESFGVVLLEAMSAGAAVIASDIPGYRLAGGDAAHFTPPGDAEALAEAIRRLIADDAQRRELIERGRQRAAAHSFEQLASRYRELYAIAVAGGHWRAGR